MSTELQGRELDALVAEKVMGWTGVLPNTDHTSFHGISPCRDYPAQTMEVPHYSTAPAAMMLVVEELQKRPYPLKMERWPKMDEWQVASGEAYGIARTLPEAVCRAALAAVKGGGK